jgi:hypothetical protein
MELNITRDAKDIYHEFYMNIESSIHAKRLDTYALRLMGLLAVNEKKSEVDAEIVRNIIDIINWQYEVRQLHDPIDADNKIAQMEEKIRRSLRQRVFSDRDLKRRTNAHRSGLWFYNTALNNLKKANEIRWNKKSGGWVLI